MSEPLNPIFEKFAESLANLHSHEKKLIAIYAKLEKAAHTPELSKCLSPVSTDNVQHLKRLALIKMSISLKSRIKPEMVNQPLIKIKKPSSHQDLDLVEYALILQNQKLAYYEFLHPIAVALALQKEAELIEQSISDNRNTNTWLRQIIQNILVPNFNTES